MISDNVKSYFLNEKYPLVKDGDEVAVIYTWHKLDHAMLILTSDMYNVVPVLNRDSQVVGLISMSRIVKAAMRGENISFDDLNNHTAEEVMDGNVAKVVEGRFSLDDILQRLVNTNFLCVVDDEDLFKGIITRSTILRGTNNLVHNIHQDFDLHERA